MILYNPPWTEQVCHRLVQIREKTSNARDIAEQLNEEFGLTLTRNATIGRMHRMGLTGTKHKRVTIPPPPPPPVKVDAPIEPVLPAPCSDGISIYQLTNQTCKWPLEGVMHHPPYTYCGHQTYEGLPYCAAHCAKAYNAPRMQWE